MTGPRRIRSQFDPKAWAEVERRGAERVSETRPISKPAPVRVVVELHPVIVALLDVTSAHLGKTRDETIADGLRCLFAALPRPGDEQ